MSLRSAMGFILGCLLAALPSLACLPNSSMTAAEMECCKKMAGNCDMGSGNHKCCNTAGNRTNPTAVTLQKLFQYDFLVVIAASYFAPPELESAYDVPSFRVPTSPSPPGDISVLRI